MDAILSILKAFEDKMQNTLKLGRYSHNDSKFLILLKITGNLYYQLTLDSIDTFFVSKPINRKIHILLGWDIHETHKAELEELVAPTKPAGSKAPSVSFGFPKQFNEQFEPAPFDEFPNSRVNRQVQLSPYQEKIPVKENLGIDSPESSNSGGTSQGLMSAFAGGNVGTVTSAFFSSPTIKSLIDAGSNTPFAAAFGQAAQPAMGLIQSYTAFGNGGKTMPSNQNSMLSLLEKSERSDMITLNYDRNSASSSYNSRDTSMNTRYQASLSVRETKNESSEKEMFYSQPSDIASSTPQTILSQDENMNDTAALDEATMHLNEELPFDSFISGYEKRITSDKDGKIARKYKTTIDKLGLSLKLVKEKNIIVIYRNINSRISYLLCHDEKGKLKILDEKTGSVISLAIKVNKNNGRAEFTDAKGNPINWNPFATTK